MHVLNCDEGPGEEVACADALEPGGLGREACGTVEVPDCAFNAREFVNIVDGFTWVGSTEELDMLYHGRRRGYGIEGVEGTVPVGPSRRSVCWLRLVTFAWRGTRQRF